MGFFGDMLDDLGPDGLFATPEERAQQRGVRRAKEELAHREYLARAESDPPPTTPATPTRPGFFGNLMDDLDPDSLFATSEERAAQRNSRQASEELAYRQHMADAEAEAQATKQTTQPSPETAPPLTGPTGWMLIGLLALSPILILIAGYSVFRLRQDDAP